MGLSEQLGVGGVFAGYSPVNYELDLQRAMQQQYVPKPFCIHPNCPICLENDKKIAEESKRQEELKTQKKLEYKNRCKAYMDKFNAKVER